MANDEQRVVAQIVAGAVEQEKLTEFAIKASEYGGKQCHSSTSIQEIHKKSFYSGAMKGNGVEGGRKNVENCSYCGRNHRLGMRYCPAIGQKCNNCKRMNHFANVCKAVKEEGKENIKNEVMLIQKEGLYYIQCAIAGVVVNFLIDSDASGVGLGAVLVQVQEDVQRELFMFASKSLTKQEATYPQIHREALAIVWAKSIGVGTIAPQVNAIFEEPIAKTITLEVVRQQTEEDEELRLVMQAVESERWSSNLKYWKAFQNELTVRNGILLKGHQIVLPETLRGQALRNAHVAHAGICSNEKNIEKQSMVA
ncbi:hypothetical protein PVAND_010720 [Polypedilum vanderplanki]|uniref:Reverse transcriptase/retrotransposon-derived protein RNase H-like domain-containing protein n=1 Tax=Polypedilum vanderplanki TaxID=319348 RepID=A0A9J6CH53_POLVA|nr:hypothetical protein PVAND_010720 [Polypedilum vanderplanki]